MADKDLVNEKYFKENAVDLTSDQTIYGTKVIPASLFFKHNQNTYPYGYVSAQSHYYYNSSGNGSYLYLSTNYVRIRSMYNSSYGGIDVVIDSTKHCKIEPTGSASDFTCDLGSSTHKFENIYLSGYISNGTKNVAVSEIVTNSTLNTYYKKSETYSQSEINTLVNAKVDKITGKGLSTNDLTSTLKASYDDAVDKAHTHSNKTILDNTTASYTSELNTKLTNISPNAKNVADNHTVANGTILINGTQTTVYDDTEVRGLIAAKETGWVIDSQSNITGTKDSDENYTNVTAITGLDLSKVKIGDNIYIKDTEVPDYWVSAKTTSNVLSLTTLSTKIDLSNYYTKTETNSLLNAYATTYELISHADNSSIHVTSSEKSTWNAKQDAISDLTTIRSGAQAGATAVQPSSLATVATTGSYNDLSNKPTIPNIPTGPSGGRYNLVWNGNTGNFVFELVPHSQCPNGQYYLGFSQCIDPGPNGTDYGFIADSTGDRGSHSYNTATYGLTTDQTWGATLYTGDKVTGIASCNSTPGTYAESTNQNFNQTDKGQYCWCKMTFPAVSRWVSSDVRGDAARLRAFGECGAKDDHRADSRRAVGPSVPRRLPLDDGGRLQDVRRVRRVLPRLRARSGHLLLLALPVDARQGDRRGRAGEALGRVPRPLRRAPEGEGLVRAHADGDGRARAGGRRQGGGVCASSRAGHAHLDGGQPQAERLQGHRHRRLFAGDQPCHGRFPRGGQGPPGEGLHHDLLRLLLAAASEPLHDERYQRGVLCRQP